MRWLFAMVRWELRLSLRSWRAKGAVLVYLALCAVPPVIFYAIGRTYDFGPMTFLDHLLRVQPFLTLLLTVLVSGHRSGAGTWPETWPVLASAPVGNARYLLGRWAAVLALVLPVSLVPLLVAAGVAVAAGNEWPSAGTWIASWAIRIVPLVLIAGALWLGTVTILGGELPAMAATLIGVPVAFGILNQVLFAMRLRVELSLTLGSFDNLGRWLARLGDMTGRFREGYASYLAASEGPLDVRAAFEQAVAVSLLGCALAVCVLGLAAAFVRRTRRDLKPRPVRADHPLRTYLLLFLRLRERLAPTAALSRGELLAMGCGVLVLAGGLAVNVERQRHFQRLAWERYDAEIGDPFAPMATAVKPLAWSLSGEIAPSGAVAVEVTGTLVNRGGEPCGRLAFALNEHLTIDALDVPGRRAKAERAWDRVQVTVEPPLAAGETLELAWRLSGVPAEIHFPFLRRGSDAFVTQVGNFRTARFSSDLSDLSRSQTWRAAAPRGIELRAPELTPVPRYTPWTLAAKELTRGGDVPEEVVLPEVELEVDLVAPAGVVLGDVCGHLSRAETEGGRLTGHGRLVGHCRTALASYAVYGGHLEIHDDEGVVFAALPAHRELAAAYRASLARAARLSHQAWPGLPGFDGLVAMELVATERSDSEPWWMWGELDLRGKLLLVQEKALGTGYLPKGERLVADLLTRDLLARREPDESQALFFRHLYAALMLQRMGVAEQRDATVSGPPWLRQVLETPLLGAQQQSGFLWDIRLPAVLIDLESRVGSRALFDALERFLGEGDAKPGTVAALFAILEAESGVALGRFYDDFLAGAAVPELRLAGVEWRRQGDAFRVTGRLENQGTGQVVCPVLVKTEIGTVKTLVTVDGGAAAPFDVTVTTRPHTVHLDPDGTCHRLVTVARDSLERVELQG